MRAPPPRALIVHHLDPAGPDLAAQAIERAGYEIDHRHPLRGEPLPHPREGHEIALMHGSLADVTRLSDPAIAEEMRWIEAWWGTDRPFFGICHGMQLAAQLLGARVGPPAHGQAEFGFYPLHGTVPGLVPDGLHVFQWHYYGADLPPGAELLASSDLFPNQAMRFGPARMGLQCHAEQGAEGRARLARLDPAGPLRPGAQALAEQGRLARRHSHAQARWFEGVLDRWLETA